MRRSITALILLSVITLSTNATSASKGNPVKGAELFKQCAACHAIGKGAADGVGPQLNHVFGRRAGNVEGYSYSEAMLAKAEEDSLLWHEETLYTFLAGPQYFIKGTTMGFAGLRREKEIRDLIAYLIQFSPAYEAESEVEVTEDALASASPLPAAPGADEVEEVPEFSADYLALGDAIKGGGELWAKQCRHCHGNSAYPGKAPKLTPASYKADFVFDRLTNGFKKMPAWKSVFSLEERKSIVAYILSDSFSP